MYRWERRLKDLSIILSACGKNYFDPELFRLNTNQFLTTARTVSFLFQKDKASIPIFEDWHEKNILKPWSTDPIMRWSLESRNIIEKQGDLDLHSELTVKLIYSYLEECDLILECQKEGLLGANIKRLIRYAQRELPSGVSDAAVLKIERKWVANTLPSSELLHALTYIYARMFQACEKLSKHLSSTLDKSIPEATFFDEVLTGDRGVTYIKLNDRNPSSLASKRTERDPNYKPPAWLVDISKKRELKKPCNLSENVLFHSELAKANFEHFGNHLPMLFLFNEKFEVIDFVGVIPDDQATKFIFWRSIADRIFYLKASSVIWISEAWIRGVNQRDMSTPIRKLPITGEILQIVGLDGSGKSQSICWNIKRSEPNAPPNLELQAENDSDDDAPEITPYFLVPVKRAFEKLLSTKTT